jgi:hypothetical protein
MDTGMTERRRIAIYGASGYTGRQVVGELARRGASPVLVGRDVQRLEAVARSGPGSEVRVARLDDPQSLRASVDGCAAVINAAGPFATSAEPIVRAALDAGAHYLDFTAEQEVVVDLFDSWDARAREAGVAVMARHRRAWRDGKLVLDRGEPRFGSFYYPGRGTEGVMEDYPLPEAVTVPRHLGSRDVRLVMAAATLQAIFSPDAPQPDAIDDEARAASRFMVVVEAGDGESQRRTVAIGGDIYGITAPIVAEAAVRLIDSGLSGTLAPAQAFDAGDFLQVLIPEWLTIEPAPGPGGKRPDDAAGFVFAAERATDERDAAATASLYADGATLEMVTDGALSRFRGSGEISAAWRQLMQAIDEAQLVLRKQLVAAGPDVIANEWRGTTRAGEARGSETWVFDAEGKVREHRLLTSLGVRPETT